MLSGRSITGGPPPSGVCGMGAIRVGMGLISGQRITPGKPLASATVPAEASGRSLGPSPGMPGGCPAGVLPEALPLSLLPCIIMGISPPMVRPMASRTVRASPRNARGMLLGGLGSTPREASAKTVASAAPAAKQKPARAWWCSIIAQTPLCRVKEMASPGPNSRTKRRSGSCAVANSDWCRAAFRAAAV